MNALSFLVLSSEELQISFPLPAVRVLLAMTNITFYFATEKDSTPCFCWTLSKVTESSQYALPHTSLNWLFRSLLFCLSRLCVCSEFFEQMHKPTLRS